MACLGSPARDCGTYSGLYTSFTECRDKSLNVEMAIVESDEMTWKVRTSQQVWIFFWLLAGGKLLTNEERSKRAAFGMFSLDYQLSSGLFGTFRIKKSCNSKALLTIMEAWTMSLGAKGGLDDWSCNSMTKGCWQFPANEWIKVNVDGLVLTMRQKVSIGGVVRGPNGAWMGGFEMKIGLSDIFQVEARALLEGLKFVWAQGYRQVEIESDNVLLIVVIQNGLAVSSKYSEVRQVYEWCFKVWDVTFHQILKDSNRVVGRIAKEAGGEMEQLIAYVDPSK
ncbi:hypothetical protein Goshw_027885, partial [Gossypium schwendimanii]|nr:hypothetical protein [Gossypium schwendimanii]